MSYLCYVALMWNGENFTGKFMDTLAYTHLAVEYQSPKSPKQTESSEHIGKTDLQVSERARSPQRSQPRPKQYSRFKLVSAMVCLSVLGFASSAMALLQRGDSGDEVSNLQEALSQKGFFDGPITGFFGELTEAAVIRFQEANGLDADGIVGPATEAALNVSSSSGTGGTTTGSGGSNTSATGGTAIASSGTLRSGDEGPAVRSLQETLTRLNYYDGPITGFFGPLTEAAVIRFQQEKGLTADGIVGSQTLAALQTGERPVPVPVTDSGGQSSVVGSTALADVQRKLKAAGYYFGPIDGIYGPQTESAIRDFQTANGLTPDGFLGPDTQAALNRQPGGGPVTPTPTPTPLPVTPLPQPTTPAQPSPTPPVIVGKLPYVVVVPIVDGTTLTSVRQIVPGAVLADSRLGKYANAGMYADRAGADSLTKQLRSAGLDARVAYFP